MPQPAPSLFLFQAFVRSEPNNGKQGLVLSSGARLASGFDEEEDDADSVVRSLQLEAYLAAAPDLSSLTLEGGSIATAIQTIDQNLIVLESTFPHKLHRRILLIYDTIDRSLLMIPEAPLGYQINHSARILVARRHAHDGGDGSSYALVVQAQEIVSVSDEGIHQRRDVLFVSQSSPSASPWNAVKAARFADNRWLADKSSFYADVVFSAGGRGYWGDLLRGVMYCDCDALLSDGIDPVDLYSIPLPPVGCCHDGFLDRDVVTTEPRAYRTLGCVNGSVKLVSIDGFLERVDLEDRKLTLWRLTEDLSCWTVEAQVTLGSLWKEAGFRRHGLPMDMAPMFPFLSVLEDQVIYFALGEYTQGKEVAIPTTAHYLLRVDMRASTLLGYPPLPAGSDHFSMASLVSSSLECWAPVAFSCNGGGGNCKASISGQEKS